MPQKPSLGKRMIGLGVENWFINTGRIGGNLIGIGFLCFLFGAWFMPIFGVIIARKK